MKYLILTFALLVLTSRHLPAQHDVSLPGEVVEQNSQFNTGKVNYLSGVEIKAEGNRTLSDTKGLFTLRFADKPLGASVWVHVAKQGYELVNEEDMKHAAVTGRNTRLKVVMCTAGQRYECQMKYYAIARDAKVEGYNKQIAILEKEGKEQNALLAQMAKDYNLQRLSADSARALLYSQLLDAQRQAQELADKFVTVNLDDQTETYRRAFRAFMDKDIYLAIRIMDSVDLKARLEQNQEDLGKDIAIRDSAEVRIAKRKEQMRQDVQQAVLSARIHKLKYAFHDADSMYALAVRFVPDSSSLELRFEYALFLQEQNRFPQAKGIYSDLLAKYRVLCSGDSDAHGSNLAKTLNNLGMLERGLGHDSIAGSEFDEALTIYRGLSEEQSGTYLPYVAAVLNNQGMLLRDLGQPREALSRFEEATLILRGSHNGDSLLTLRDLAMTLNNAAFVLSDLGEFSGAKFRYQESLEIYRRLVGMGSEVYLPDLVTALNNFGILSMNLGELTVAKEHFKEALVGSRILAERSPELYMSTQAQTLRLHALAMMGLGETQEAIQNFEASLEILQRVAEENGGDNQRIIGSTLRNLGRCLIDGNDSIAGLDRLRDAMDMLSACFEQNPKENAIEAAQCAMELAKVHLDNFLDKVDTTQRLECLRYLAAMRGYLLANRKVNSETESMVEWIELAEIDLYVYHALENIGNRFPNTNTALIKLQTQLAKLEVLEGIRHILPQNKVLLSKVADGYGNLSWYQILNQNFREAEVSALHGLELSPSSTGINTNLVLALLFQGKWRKARDLYQRLMNVPDGEQTFREAFLGDLDTLESKGMMHPSVKRARSLLQR